MIPGDIYINTLVSGLIEFPAYGLCIILLQKLGRRGPLAFMYFLLCVSLLISLGMPNDTGVIAMVTIGKFGAVCAFAIIYVQAVEIFPTVIRNTGIGSCSSMARVGSVLAPIIGRELAKINRDLTIVIFAIVSLVAGLLTLFLPETLGRNLPDSLEEGNVFFIVYLKHYSTRAVLVLTRVMTAYGGLPSLTGTLWGQFPRGKFLF